MNIVTRIITVLAATWLLASPSSAQNLDNMACDAACPVPCYFGTCAPADATFKRALARCDLQSLESVAQLYAGTRSAEKVPAALNILRSRGYGTSRIGVTPNTAGGDGGVEDCTALVEGGNTTGDLCDLVNPPSGFQCTVVGGRVEFIASGTPATIPAPAPAPAASQGCRGLIAPAGTRCELDSAGNAYFVTVAPAVAPAQPQLAPVQVQTPDRVFGSGECFEYNPSNGPAVVKVSVGGAICMRGIPKISVQKSDGCKRFTAGGTEGGIGKIRFVVTGRSYSFDTEFGEVTFMASCLEAKTYNTVYSFRLSTL